MLGPSLTVAHLAIATICTALMIGLGFLARPGRATVLWSAMFAMAMAKRHRIDRRQTTSTRFLSGWCRPARS